MVRKKGAFALFIGYVWITTLAGLAIHPYKSIRGMVGDNPRRILLPVVLTPAVSILIMLVVGRLGSYVFDVNGLKREVMSLLLGIVSLSFFMWQILMIYLVFRFSKVIKKG